jgi:hypothetical protein
MYLFSYGANMSDEHLHNLNIIYKNIDVGYLYNYKLIFNHFSLYGNVEKDSNNRVFGTIIEIDEDNLQKLIKKELLYKLIDVKIKTNKGKIYECRTFQSQVPLFEFFVPKYYQKIIRDVYEKYNIDFPNMNQSYEQKRAIINSIGVLFGLYLFLYTDMKIIGGALFITDLSMVLDQILNDNKVFYTFKNKYNLLFGIFFKIIPLFIFAPILYKKSNGILLKIAILLFIIIDVLALLNHFI